MANPKEIVVDPRSGNDEDSGGEAGANSVKSTKRRRSRKRRNSGRSDISAQILPSFRDPEARLKEDENGEQSSGQQTGGIPDALFIREDHRPQFYEHYRKEAEEFDKEFMKKYDEDLNTTLIFAGLFSAVTSAFIIEVHSHLLPDPNDDTAALLRVLINKIDNTTFGNDPPALPQWTGPPRSIVKVQAILFASLSVSLFSAFLAMLGKQWLNQYASTDMRGTAIERSQNRQRKLDGVITWYFDHVMESLPLMLQIGLLLLGCALSHYLWGIDVTVASVVLGFTSLGILFYFLVVVAGTASESCPYQTPGARILRHVLPHILLPALRSVPSFISKLPVLILSAFPRLIQKSHFYSTISLWWSLWRSPMGFRCDIHTILICTLGFLPLALVLDLLSLGLGIFWLPIASGKAVYRLLTSTYPQTDVVGQQAITSDLRCISWMLQTSLDKFVRLSTLKHLATMALADFDPTIVADCFSAFVGCINISDHSVVIVQGSEELAAWSALCFFNTLSHLLALCPTSGVLEEIRRRYNKVFPYKVRFHGHQFCHTLDVIHHLFTSPLAGRSFEWVAYGITYEPSTHEHTIIAHILMKVALLGYQRTQRVKVPRWILRFAAHSLSLDPPPPISVVANCLSIIALDLGCDISDTGSTTSDESVRVRQVSSLITQKVNTMAEAEELDELRSKRKAAVALLPYVVSQERDGQPDMLDTLLRAARATGTLMFTWRYSHHIATAVLSKATPHAIVLVSPCFYWESSGGWEHLIQQWAAATSVVPYTEDVAQSVVAVLLDIVQSGYLTNDAWSWLTRCPPLPPICHGRHRGTNWESGMVVRGLKDVRILKSYLLVVWTEWDTLQGGFKEMCASIQKYFCGIGMGHHRADLIQRLDHVLGQLDRGLEYLKQHNPDLDEDSLQEMERQYSRLREILLEVNIGTISQSRATFMCALPLPCP